MGLRSFETFRSCFRVLKIYQLENPKILIPVLSTSILLPRKNYATKLKIKFEKALNTDTAALRGKKISLSCPFNIILHDIFCGKYDYSRRTVRVLNGVNMNINPGERVALVGESGSGKTTIMHLLQR